MSTVQKYRSALELTAVQEHINAELALAYGEASSEKQQATHLAQYKGLERVLGELLNLESPHRHKLPQIKIQEAVHAADFQILFPRAIEGALQRAKEGRYIGQSLLARTVRMEGARYFTFPAMGGMIAAELGETEEPPEQKAAFKEYSREIRSKRYGLKIEFVNSVIEQARWDIVALFLDEAGKALARKREELIFNEYDARAFVAFDNSLTTAAKQTRGKGSNGTTANGTFDHRDLYDMIAILGANGGNASDIIIHPLMQAVWLQDPFLRYHLLHRGAVGQSMGTPTYGEDGIPSNMDVYMPFGLTTLVTPFQTVSIGTALTTGVTGTAANYTSVTVVDRDSKLVVLEDQPARMLDYGDVLRNIKGMMIDERYGLQLLDGGRSAVVAKNVRVDLNSAPVYSVTSVTPA